MGLQQRKERKNVSTFRLRQWTMHMLWMDLLLPDSTLLLEMNYDLFEIPDFF